MHVLDLTVFVLHFGLRLGQLELELSNSLFVFSELKTSEGHETFACLGHSLYVTVIETKYAPLCCGASESLGTSPIRSGNVEVDPQNSATTKKNSSTKCEITQTILY